MRDRLVLPVIGVISIVVVLLVGYLLLGHAPGRGGRHDAATLPALNALLNGASAVLLSAGWIFVKRRRIAAHRACMLAAFSVSVLFLVSYVIYHALAGSRGFTGTGLVRWIYFPLLVSHIVLAAAMVPFVLTTSTARWAPTTSATRGWPGERCRCGSTSRSRAWSSTGCSIACFRSHADRPSLTPDPGPARLVALNRPGQRARTPLGRDAATRR